MSKELLLIDNVYNTSPKFWKLQKNIAKEAIKTYVIDVKIMWVSNYRYPNTKQLKSDPCNWTPMWSCADCVTNRHTILWLPTGLPCLSILKHTKVNRKLQNGYSCSKSPYNALQTLEHWVRHVCLWIVSRLFDFATKNLHLATIFYHLVAKWRLNNFFNFEPWYSEYF